MWNLIGILMGVVSVTKICNKMNRGFSSKDSFKEEERKRKNRERSQRYRDEKMAKILGKKNKKTAFSLEAVQHKHTRQVFKSLS